MDVTRTSGLCAVGDFVGLVREIGFFGRGTITSGSGSLPGLRPWGTNVGGVVGSVSCVRCTVVYSG